MTFYPDLAHETPIEGGAHVRAVGWLQPDEPFPVGDVAPEALERIRAFCTLCFESSVAMQWPMAMGVHTCEFCGDVAAGGNFAVPGGRVLYIAPELLYHYVEIHRYLPPPEFIQAILESPLPGSAEYDIAVSDFR